MQSDNKSDGSVWISAREISGISGALKPSSYIARAYQYSRRHKGSLPEWAKKDSDGKWLFLETYVRGEAGRRQKTISVSEAAEFLGAAKRTVQKWVDAGLIKAEEGDRKKGSERRIVKEDFVLRVDDLKKRLEKAAVVRFKQEQGHKLPDDLVRRVEEEIKGRRNEAKKRINSRRKSKRAVLRRSERSRTLEDRYRRVRAARISAETQRDEIVLNADKLSRDESRLKSELRQTIAEAKAEQKAVERDLRSAVMARRLAEGRAKAKTEAAKRLFEKEENLLKEKSRLESELRVQVDASVSKKAQKQESAKVKLDKGSRKEKMAKIEEQLRLAREKRQALDYMEKRAVLLAAKVLNDIFDGTIGRIEGMALFDRLATEQGISEDIRSRIRKKHFGI